MVEAVFLARLGVVIELLNSSQKERNHRILSVWDEFAVMGWSYGMGMAMSRQNTSPLVPQSMTPPCPSTIIFIERKP